MMTTKLFVIANVKQLRTGGSFRILLPFFWTSWGIGILNSAIFNSFSQSGWVWHDFGGPSEFQGAEVEPPQHPPPLVRHWVLKFERRSTRSHSVQNSLWKRLWTCLKTDCGMNDERRHPRSKQLWQLGKCYVVKHSYVTWGVFNDYI